VEYLFRADAPASGLPHMSPSSSASVIMRVEQASRPPPLSSLPGARNKIINNDADPPRAWMPKQQQQQQGEAGAGGLGLEGIASGKLVAQSQEEYCSTTLVL